MKLRGFISPKDMAFFLGMLLLLGAIGGGLVLLLVQWLLHHWRPVL